MEEDKNTSGVDEKGTQTNNGTGSSNNENSGSDVKDKTFTQAQVESIKAAEKQSARDSVFKELGLSPDDTKVVSMFKAFIESQKTEEQKGEEEKAKAAAEIAKSEHRARIAEAKAEALLIGANSEYVDDIITLAMSKVANNEGVDVKAAINEIKTKYPSFFTKSDDSDKGGKGSVGEKGTGTSIKGDNKGSKVKKDEVISGLGKRLAQGRAGSQNKSSFWS